MMAQVNGLHGTPRFDSFMECPMGRCRDFPLRNRRNQIRIGTFG